MRARIWWFGVVDGSQCGSNMLTVSTSQASLHPAVTSQTNEPNILCKSQCVQQPAHTARWHSALWKHSLSLIWCTTCLLYFPVLCSTLHTPLSAQLHLTILLCTLLITTVVYCFPCLSLQLLLLIILLVLPCLLESTLHYSTVFCSTPLYSVLLHCTLLCSTCSILLYSTLYSTLYVMPIYLSKFCFTPPCSTRFYFPVLYYYYTVLLFTELCSAVPCTLLHSILHYTLLSALYFICCYFRV